MRKNLIIGSLLVVFLMLLLPAVSAEDSRITQSAQTSSSLLKAQEIYLETMVKKYMDGPSPQPILLTLAILLLKLLRWGVLIFDGVILLIILRIIRGGSNNSSSLAI
jgi:hypothetical protein